MPLLCLWGMWSGRQRDCSPPSGPLLSHSCLLWPEHCPRTKQGGWSPIQCNELSITVITSFGFGWQVRGHCSLSLHCFPTGTAFVCLSSAGTRVAENCFSSVAQGVWSGVQPSSQVGSSSKRVPNTIPRPTPFEHRQKNCFLSSTLLRGCALVTHTVSWLA